jgi:hypothetical protein
LEFNGKEYYIDILLCHRALQDIHKPIGIAEYQLLLPTKELEAMVLRELKSLPVEEKEDQGEAG